MKKRFILSILISLVALGSYELLARALLPVVPNCTEAVRNPFRFRGWPEYISESPVDQKTGVVVLITNCQGYGGEYPPQNTYPAFLERILSEKKVGGFERWQVLNWSVDGASPMEYTLMAAYLMRRPATVVLAVTGFADFRVENFHEGLLFCRSDTPRLISRAGVVGNLPFGFIARHTKLEDTLTVLMTDRFALPRFKEYMWSWLDRRFPGIHNVFYAPKVNYLPWAVKADPCVEPLQIQVPQDSAINILYGDESKIMIREYLGVLARVPAKEKIVVSEPRMDPAVMKDVGRQKHFQDDLQSATSEYGLTFWDLQNALPQEDFLTSNHLNHRSHRTFARMLADRIEAQFLNRSGETVKTTGG